MFVFFFLKASKGDEYISIEVDDIISPILSSAELRSASQPSESSALVLAEDNKYVAITSVHVLDPAKVIKKNG